MAAGNSSGLQPHELKALAIELCAAMPPIPTIVELSPSGEILSRESMDIARFHHRATPAQRAALQAVVDAFGGTP